MGYIFKDNKITIRKSSLDKLYNRLGRVFAKYGIKGNQDLDQLHYKVNLVITGCFYEEKAIGWLCYFKYMNDLPLLYCLDKYVEKLFKRFNVPLKRNKLKRFVRSYWEVQKGIQSKYLPKYKMRELSLSVFNVDSNKDDKLDHSKNLIDKNIQLTANKNNVLHDVIDLENHQKKISLKELMSDFGEYQPYSI